MVKKKKSKKKKLSPAERKKRQTQTAHRRLARSTFRNSGFERFPFFSDKQITVDGQNGDYDDVFVFENIVVVAEYTTASDVGDHLKPKKIFFDKTVANVPKFTAMLAAMDGDFAKAISAYSPEELRLRIVYCSLEDVEPKYKSNVPTPIYMDYPILRYFESLSDTIKKSSRFELFDFLGVPEDEIGEDGQVSVGQPGVDYAGSVLPRANSNFPPGFQVVSFYVDPAALIRRAYVLRKDGWREESQSYQRLVSKAKVDSIRRHLKSLRRVFVNNIIATLPHDATIKSPSGKAVDTATISRTTPIEINLPNRINTVGLIDGQHRTYSYYEADPDDPEVAKLRKKQNLLVTGIVYPSSYSKAEQKKFEAKLFLEINSTQTNAKSNLKQAIGLVLDPFSDESIATRVIYALGRSGALGGHIQRYWFEDNRLKTTSIVSYGLKLLVRPTDDEDSLFSIWNQSGKSKMVPEQDHDLLEKYVSFCTSQIDEFLGAARASVDGKRWTTDKSIKNRLLNTTVVNGLLICLRLLVKNKKVKAHSYYKGKLVGLDSFNFKKYHSSQYGKMAEEIAKTHFGIIPPPIAL